MLLTVAGVRGILDKDLTNAYDDASSLLRALQAESTVRRPRSAGRGPIEGALAPPHINCFLKFFLENCHFYM